MTNTLPQPFTVDGRYEIGEKPLGEGGSSVLYKAYDIVTKRFVALKTVGRDAPPAAAEFFAREWAALARLSHPNIVDILDTGEAEFDGRRRPYFVMPLLEGKTLAETLHASPSPPSVERAVDIVVQACRGLHAAHDQNLIHRGIKPSNLFLLSDDTVKIIDFAAPEPTSGPATNEPRPTPYLAPEQCDGQPATPLSDIFSLAVVCYEALTGRQPFARAAAAETSEAIRAYVPPPASDINPAVNQSLSRAVHKAMAKLPAHRFSDAREFGEALERALRNEPSEILDPSKIQPRIERVKKAYAEGDFQFALEVLTELESEGHIDPDLADLRARVEHGARQKNIRQLLENARIRLSEEEYPLALHKVAAVLALDPSNVEAQTLQLEIERARIAGQVANLFRQVRAHVDNNLFGQARLGLQEILKIDPSSAEARQMLLNVDRTEQESIKTAEEKQRLYDSALASYGEGEVNTALSFLERVIAISRRGARSSTPDLDAQCQTLYDSMRAERDAAHKAYAEGREHLLARRIGPALAICDEFLEKHPADPMFQALKLEAEEVQRAEKEASIAEASRRADAEPDLDKKQQILEAAVAEHPDEQHFRSALKLISGRREFVNAIVGRARHYEERGQFSDAAGQWEILRNVYPLYPGLDAELERLKHRRDEQLQAEAKARWLEQIEGHLHSGDYEKALAAATEALSGFSADLELTSLQAAAQQGAARSAEAAALLKQGQELCAARNYMDGLVALRRADRLDPRNRLARAALLNALVAQARELMVNDWRSAEAPVKEALDLEPADPVARSLLSILDDHRRQHAIGNILNAARNYQADGHVSDALRLVERGLVQYPNDHRLTQLAAALRAHAESLSLAVISPPRVDPAAHPAPPEPPAETHQPKFFAAPLGVPAVDLPPAIPLDAPPAVPREVPPPPAAEAKPAPRPRPSAPPRPRVPVASTPAFAPPPALGSLDEFSFKGPIWGVAALVALALILAAGLYSVFHKSQTETPSSPDARANAAPKSAPPEPSVPTRVVEFSANIPGAAFTEDGQPLAASTLLKVGTHNVEASRDGYLPEVKTFTVDEAATVPIAVRFDLRPVLAQIRVSSPIAGGRLIIDESEPIILQSGVASKDDLALGPHTVRIFDGPRQVFAFGFEAVPNRMPILTAPLDRQPAAGIVISSLAGAAKVYATLGLRAAASLPLAPVPPPGLDLPGSPTNPARFLVDTGKRGHPQTHSVDTSPYPTLTVQLAGAPEPPPDLIVTSNVAGCQIAVDGKTLSQPMRGKSAALPLDPGDHPVQLTCPGYREMEQVASIKPEETGPQKLDFVLTPMPPPTAATARRALFTLAGAPAGTAVFQNQIRIGTVGPDGVFSREVEPGSYTWEWRRAGFEPGKESRTLKPGESLRLDGAMTPNTATLLLKVQPESARIAIHRDADNSTLTASNNVPVQLPAGAYHVTAAAPEYRDRTETLSLTGGKSLTLSWDLEKNAAVAMPVRFFENGDSWKQLTAGENWWVHSGSGYSSLRLSTGAFRIEFFKKKGRQKKINLLADCPAHENCIVYSLDGHNLSVKVLADGQTVLDEKKPHGMDESPSYELLFEMSPDEIVVKNRAGQVLSSVVRKNPGGKLSIQDDNPLTVN